MEYEFDGEDPVTGQPVFRHLDNHDVSQGRSQDLVSGGGGHPFRGGGRPPIFRLRPQITRVPPYVLLATPGFRGGRAPPPPPPAPPGYALDVSTEQGSRTSRPVYRIQRREGAKAQFSTTGGAKAPKSQNSAKIIRVPLMCKSGPQISGGGHGPLPPPCIRACAPRMLFGDSRRN